MGRQRRATDKRVVTAHRQLRTSHIKTINWSAVLEDRIGDRSKAGQAQARKADQGNHLCRERGAGPGHLYRLAAKAKQHHLVINSKIETKERGAGEDKYRAMHYPCRVS